MKGRKTAVRLYCMRGELKKNITEYRYCQMSLRRDKINPNLKVL